VQEGHVTVQLADHDGTGTAEVTLARSPADKAVLQRPLTAATSFQAGMMMACQSHAGHTQHNTTINTPRPLL